MSEIDILQLYLISLLVLSDDPVALQKAVESLRPQILPMCAEYLEAAPRL